MFGIFLKPVTHRLLSEIGGKRRSLTFVQRLPPGLLGCLNQQTSVSRQTVHFRARAGLFEDNLSEALLVPQSDCGLALSPLLEVDAVIRLNLTVDQWRNPDCRLHINPTVPVCL